jgi:hypothetical protein
MSLRDVSKEWEANAEQWAAWARTPGHDVWFWAWNLPGFAELLPEPGVGKVASDAFWRRAAIGCGVSTVRRC